MDAGLKFKLSKWKHGLFRLIAPCNDDVVFHTRHDVQEAVVDTPYLTGRHLQEYRHAIR
jgi:hypothetical protein